MTETIHPILFVFEGAAGNFSIQAAENQGMMARTSARQKPAPDAKQEFRLARQYFFVTILSPCSQAGLLAAQGQNWIDLSGPLRGNYRGDDGRDSQQQRRTG
jgi:hypothetical protein